MKNLNVLSNLLKTIMSEIIANTILSIEYIIELIHLEFIRKKKFCIQKTVSLQYQKHLYLESVYL